MSFDIHAGDNVFKFVPHSIGRARGGRRCAGLVGLLRRSPTLAQHSTAQHSTALLAVTVDRSVRLIAERFGLWTLTHSLRETDCGLL